mgnify:CR=1 FL=1
MKSRWRLRSGAAPHGLTYFLGGKDPYEKLQKALRAEINEEAWETLGRAERSVGGKVRAAPRPWRPGKARLASERPPPTSSPAASDRNRGGAATAVPPTVPAASVNVLFVCHANTSRSMRPCDTCARTVASARPVSSADMTGTTIETCIRIMSRWGKEEIVRTEKDGFVILDRGTLDAMAQE